MEPVDIHWLQGTSFHCPFNFLNQTASESAFNFFSIQDAFKFTFPHSNWINDHRHYAPHCDLRACLTTQLFHSFLQFPDRTDETRKNTSVINVHYSFLLAPQKKHHNLHNLSLKQCTSHNLRLPSLLLPPLRLDATKDAFLQRY